MMLLVAVSSFAVEVEIGGLWYEVISKTKEAKVIQYKNDNKYSGDIVIPSTVEYNGDNYSVTSIGGSAFYGCSGLTSVTIPNSVTSIGNSAFWNCSGLTSVTIPNSVTSIDSYTFMYCSGLTSVSIPNSVTSIGGQAFLRCSGLTSVTIPNSVTSIGGGAFIDCSGLTSVTIPNSVTSIGGSAFYRCSSLTSVTIPNSVTTIGDRAFSCCSGLTSVTIGDGIKTIGSSAFASCAELTDVYCYAENVPRMVDEYGYQCTDAFEGSYIEYATLYVPAESVSSYSSTTPWSNFKKIVPLTPEETDVKSLRQMTSANHYFMLDGRKVTGQPTKKGVYIVDGRKVVMK